MICDININSNKQVLIQKPLKGRNPFFIYKPYLHIILKELDEKT